MTECSPMRRIGDKCLCLSWVPRWREYAHMKAAVNACTRKPRACFDGNRLTPSSRWALAGCVGG